MSTDTKRALTRKEFCEQYGVGQTRFYEEVKEGRLPVRKVGRKTIVLRDAAEDWLHCLPSSTA
jgi:excisionase family DNA binding protein